jgi:hypothetical protein
MLLVLSRLSNTACNTNMMRNLLSLISPIVLLGMLGVRADDTPTPIPVCSTDQLPIYSVNGASYLLYEVAPGGQWDTGPGEIQMSFSVANTVNQVETLCTLSNFKSNGQDWDDQGTTWYSCQDQVITGILNNTYTVKTSTQFDWNRFNVTVNQTWACDNTPDT